MSEKPPPYPQNVYSTPADYGKNPNHPGAYSFEPQGTIPPPPPQAAGVTMVTTTTGPSVVMSVQPKRIFSKNPTALVCPYCGVNIVTQPRPETGTITWLSAGFLIVIGCWLGCCLIPFCIDECKDIHHDCPNCKRTVEIYKPL